MGTTVPVEVTVNGEAHASEVPARMLLVHYLRDELGLTGRTSAATRPTAAPAPCLFDGESAKSCTVLAVQCDGAKVKTIEGMARRRHAARAAGGLLGRAGCSAATARRDDHGRRRSARRTPATGRSRRRSATAWRATSAAAPATTTSSGGPGRGRDLLEDQV